MSYRDDWGSVDRIEPYVQREVEEIDAKRANDASRSAAIVHLQVEESFEEVRVWASGCGSDRLVEGWIVRRRRRTGEPGYRCDCEQTSLEMERE